MKNKRSFKQDKQQNNGGKIRRRRKRKGKKNKSQIDESASTVPSTPNNNNNQQQQRGNKKNFYKMNQAVKRLNNKNKNQNQLNFNQISSRAKQRENRRLKHSIKNKKSNPSFLDALSEYKKIRNTNHQQSAPSTSKDNQENLKAYESVTVISDDDLEDGEIIDNNQVTQYVNLIAESFNEVERSKKIQDKKSPDSSNENQPIFYVDKSADSFSEVPLYTSISDVSAEQPMDVDDNVIVLNDTQSNSDDSVIIIEDKTPIKPHFTIGSDFIALSPIPHEPQKSPGLSKKETRRERQKARVKNWKQKKMVEKVLEMHSNGLLDGIAPIKVPANLCNAVSSNSEPSTSVNNIQTIPQPTLTAPNPVPLPSTSQNIPTLSQVVQAMIQPVQSVSMNPTSLLNMQFRPPLNGNASRMPQLTSSTPLNGNAPRMPQLTSSTTLNGSAPKEREKRRILIDGSNVAMGFTASEVGKKAMTNDYREFSAEALKQVITHFEGKGFQVKAVVPEFRVRRDKSSNHAIMVELLDGNKLITTPSKSYDDLILLESAAKLDAAIVSNDLFRDIKNMKKNQNDVMNVLNKRQIRYNWVFGEFIIADDPYGRTGPKLDDILFK